MRTASGIANVGCTREYLIVGSARTVSVENSLTRRAHVSGNAVTAPMQGTVIKVLTGPLAMAKAVAALGDQNEAQGGISAATVTLKAWT